MEAPNAHGRATAITIISPVRGWWGWWLRLTWPLADRTPPLKRALLRLSFIHFAHWSLFDRVPARAPRRAARSLGRPYLLFQSNYNGSADAYIGAFSLIVPWRMRLMWQGAYGFPGPTPIWRFKRFVVLKAIPADRYHYYGAYPEASTRMVVSALELRRRFDKFARRSAEWDPERFAAGYRKWVAEVQEHL
jgi:hypothetical protein